MSYIENPKTEAEHHHNIKFQLENVTGWVNEKDYESALIKTKYLIKELEAVVKLKVQ